MERLKRRASCCCPSRNRPDSIPERNLSQFQCGQSTSEKTSSLRNFRWFPTSTHAGGQLCFAFDADFGQPVGF